MSTQNDEPEDLTPEIMKQAQKDIHIYGDTELWMDDDLREFRRILLAVMREDS